MGCLDLIGKIHAVGGIETISMTTNGLMLRGRMEQAKAMGLSALNISLDTADPADLPHDDARRRCARCA